MAKKKRKIKAISQVDADGNVVRRFNRNPEAVAGQEDVSATVKRLASKNVKAPQPQSIAEADALNFDSIEEGEESQSALLPLAKIPVGDLSESTMRAEERRAKVRRKKRKK